MDQDILGMAFAEGPYRPLPAPVEPGGAAQEHLQTGPETDARSEAWPCDGIRAAPFVWGSPAMGRHGGSPAAAGDTAARAAWQTFLKAAVARYGPGGTYWSTAIASGSAPSARRCRFSRGRSGTSRTSSTPIPGTTYTAEGPEVRPAGPDLHIAIRAKDPKAQIVLAGIAHPEGPERLQLPRQPLLRAAASRTASRPPPSTRTRPPTPRSRRRSSTSDP